MHGYAHVPSSHWVLPIRKGIWYTLLMHDIIGVEVEPLMNFSIQRRHIYELLNFGSNCQFMRQEAGGFFMLWNNMAPPKATIMAWKLLWDRLGTFG